MTETVNTTKENVDDPVEQALDITPPDEGKAIAKKQGMPKSIKIILGGAGAVLLFFVAYQMTIPAPPPSAQDSTGVVGVTVKEVGGFQNTQASARPVNPEATVLGQKVEQAKAAEIMKDPTKSYVTANPFGDADNQGNVPRGDGVTPGQLPPQPPQAPPENIGVEPKGYNVENNTSGNGQQQDPALAEAMRIYQEARRIGKMGVAAGNVELSAAPAQATTGNPNLTANGQPIIHESDIGAGDQVYAQLTTSLNSVVPQTPVRAVIRGGKLNGGVLLGMIENVNDRYLVLKYSTLTLNKKTYPISAIAVNPEAMDAGIVDVVNNKTWSKAALQAGVGFVQAFGAAKLEEGTTNTINPTTGATTTSTPTRSNKQTAMIGLGGAAQAIKPTIDAEVNNIKNEVIVHQGKEMGVIFLQPVYLQ